MSKSNHKTIIESENERDFYRIEHELEEKNFYIKKIKPYKSKIYQFFHKLRWGY